MEKKICPLRYSSSDYCIRCQDDCALWNEEWKMCSLALPGQSYQQGFDDGFDDAVQTASERNTPLGR